MTSAREFKQRQLDMLNRRSFVRAAGGCAALSSASIMSTLLNLKTCNAAVATQGGFEGYKAIVCVFLFGGNDSFNMLVPREDESYGHYQATRGSQAEGGLALSPEELLDVSTLRGEKFGIHHSMPELKQLYDDRKCAFLANVGTIVRPTTKRDYENRNDLPLGLFSHADHIRHWQTSIPQSRSNLTGWAGRMADLVTDSTNRSENVSMNISLSGITAFETGNQVVPYVVQPSGATVLAGHGGVNVQDRIYTKATDGMLSQTYTDLLEKTYANTRRTALDAAVEFNTAVNSVDLETQFPESYLGSQMRMIAKAVGARRLLQQRRQVFFVTVGGWDHHADTIANQERMLPDVSRSIKAFYDATVELGTANDVVTFTVSDFGRTLSSNGRGSDHAWGGNQFAVGGAVQGGDVYGDFPTLMANSDLDVGRGRLIPGMSTCEYAAELALWYGMENDGLLEDVLPNIRNFYSARDRSYPVGFLDPKTVTPPPGYQPPGNNPPGSGDDDKPSPPQPPGGGAGGFNG